MDTNRNTLKEFFQRGDRPTQEQFEDLIDSQVNKVDDQVFVTGLQPQVQLGLGEVPPADPQDPESELVRLHVDKRLSANKIKLRHGASNGFLLFSDARGNASWQPQANVDDQDWKVVDKMNPNSAMYSYYQGNVGIGTQTPSAKLTLEGIPQSGGYSLGLHVFNSKPGVGARASLSLAVSGTRHRWELTSETMPWNSESAFKLRRFQDLGETNVAVNYLWINDNTNSIHFNTRLENNTGPSGEYVLWNGNVGLNKVPSVRLDVAGDANVDGNTRTNTLTLDNAANGANTDLVLTIDGNGNVRKFPANQLITEAHGLWTDDGQWNIHAKTGRGIAVGKGAYIHEQLTVNGGIIKRGDLPSGQSLATGDLGLYSFVETAWNRYVTNGGAHKFYVDLQGATQPYPLGVLEINPRNPNGAYKVQENYTSIYGNLLVNGEFPFAMRSYQLERAYSDDNEDPSWYRNTGVPVDDYPGAAVIGFRATNWQTKDMANGRDFQVFLSRKHNGTIYQWQIVANVPNKFEEFGSDYEENDWFVQVLFIRKGLMDPASDHPGFGTL